MSPLDKITSGATTGLAGVVDRLSRRLGSGDRVRGGVTRRGVLAGAAVAGSALAVDPKAYALTPQSAYSTICGPGRFASDGWTVFCCTVNGGKNSCPPGSFAAGWWKAAGSSWCCGGYQYIVDCNAKCTGCTSGCSGDHICDRSCWNCTCGSGSTATCDQRRHCCNAFRYGQCNTQISCSGGVNCRVLSCVPPYKWESCTTTQLVDNRTAEHGAPCLEGCGEILTKYDAMGGHGSWLKASRGPERAVGDGRGRYVAYEVGYIYWTPTTGARAVMPYIKTAWDAVGGVRGPMGYPVTDRIPVTGGSMYQRFERGIVCDTTSTPVAAVHGAFYTEWGAQGLYPGRLGWPVANQVASAGGWVQNFQRGAICDGPSTGVCSVAGTIYTRWVTANRERGGVGFPTGNATTTSAGTIQVFTGGTIASPAGATVRTYLVAGPINTTYVALGRHTGVLGWPTAERQIVSGGEGQTFTGGQIWCGYGLPALAVRGAVLAAWQAAGGATGRYGFPVGAATTNPNGTSTQRFQKGTITA